MKMLSVAIVIAAALIAYGLHSLGRGVADSNRKHEISIDHKIHFDTNDPFPKQSLGIKGEGSPALHIRVDK